MIYSGSRDKFHEIDSSKFPMPDKPFQKEEEYIVIRPEGSKTTIQKMTKAQVKEMCKKDSELGEDNYYSDLHVTHDLIDLNQTMIIKGSLVTPKIQKQIKIDL